MQKMLLAAVLAAGLVGSMSAAGKLTVLKAARMFDGFKMTSPGLVVVDGDKIVAAGADAAVPSNAEVIDFGDATLCPGFIDAHTHLSAESIDDYRQYMLNGLQRTPAEQALRATENTRKTLLAGFTTTRDLGSFDFIDVGLRNAIAAGKIVGPRMLVTVHALGSTGGHCDSQGGFRFGLFGRESAPEDGVINSPDEARRAVRFNVKYGADVIKTCATGGVLSLSDEIDTPQLTQEELNALVDEAHALRKKTAAHAHGATGAKRAIRAGIDSIEHGTFLDDEALDMMKARGTFLVPTLMATQGGREKLGKGLYPPAIEAKMTAAIAAIDQTMRKALAKGVRIGLGTDAGVYPHGRNAEEFGQMTARGMSPLDALRAGTSADAELLGISTRLGSLASGKLADIVVMPGDPSQSIRQTEKVFFVMKEGVIYLDHRTSARSTN
jgi:imidazolonepropionase-like amidohydrolase